jgi:hypothetical protein
VYDKWCIQQQQHQSDNTCARDLTKLNSGHTGWVSSFKLLAANRSADATEAGLHTDMKAYIFNRQMQEQSKRSGTDWHTAATLNEFHQASRRRNRSSLKVFVTIVTNASR